MIGLLLSGVGRKVALVAGVAFAGMLILGGAYLKGMRAAEAIQTRRSFERAEKTHRRITDAETSIASAGDDPSAVRDWLRARGGSG